MKGQGVSSRSSHSAAIGRISLLGESVDPVPQRDLVVVQFHRKVAHDVTLASSSYSRVTKRTVERRWRTKEEPPPEGRRLSTTR